MIIVIHIYGKDRKYRAKLSKYIPIFILLMFIPNLMMTSKDAHDSEVIWAFTLSTIFTLF